jgi:hypothetical protein
MALKSTSSAVSDMETGFDDLSTKINAELTEHFEQSIAAATNRFQHIHTVKCVPFTVHGCAVVGGDGDHRGVLDGLDGLRRRSSRLHQV